MTRGDIYLVKKPGKPDPKRQRALVVVSIGPHEGIKHQSAAHCDELVSIPKSELTNFVGSLGTAKLSELASALRVALGIEG